MPIQREQHRRGKDGVLDDGASFYQANESHMSLYDEAKRDLGRLEEGLGKALHASETRHVDLDELAYPHVTSTHRHQGRSAN